MKHKEYWQKRFEQLHDKTFMDSAENIEDIIDTKELYAIMIEWNKILNKS